MYAVMKVELCHIDFLNEYSNEMTRIVFIAWISALWDLLKQKEKR